MIGPMWKIRYYTRRRFMRYWWALTRRWRSAKSKLFGKTVPPICSIVQWGTDSFGTTKATWRVQSYLKAVSMRGKPTYQWCSAEEATHVSVYAICGSIVPISECKVIGMVPWTPEHIEGEVRHAKRLIGQVTL